jgi:hypothetical protein
VDFVSINHKSGDVVLSISDHREWDEDGEHLVLLEEKIDRSLRFIEGGKIYERFPDLKGKNSEEADGLLRLAGEAITRTGIGLRYRFRAVT